MSDDYLILIPRDPLFVPEAQARDRAKALLEEIITPEGKQVRCEVSDEVQFIDCGANFERVLCPFCRQEIDLSFWRDAMDEAYATGFNDLSLELACCHRQSSLNDLLYDAPQGFARFSLEVMNPKEDIEGEDFERLEETLGCSLKRIRRHI